MSRFGDGLATGADLLAAADAATAQALEPLAGRVPDLVVAFVGGGDPEEAAAAAQRVAQGSGARAVLGCTASGVLAGDRGVEGRSAVAVWAAVLPGAQVRTFHLEVLTGGPTAAVVGLPPPGEPGSEVALLLADPFTFPAAGFVARANAALPGLPVVGGLVSGAASAGRARLLVDGRVVDRGAVGALLTGAGATAVVSQGCRPVGPAMTVTAAAGNVVRGLAGVPALEKVEQVLGELPPHDQALASAGLQLGLAAHEQGEEVDYVVRGVVGVERETGGLVVGDLVEVGRTVRLQVRDPDAAEADLRAALGRSGAAPAGGALLFSCAARAADLFGDAGHDAALVRRELGAPALAGFATAGELGPVGGRNGLHGVAAALLAFPG